MLDRADKPCIAQRVVMERLQDFTTLRHLEILEPLHHDALRNASLYGAVNRTATPMGARMLRNWLSQPLAAIEPIRRRQEAVQTFIDNSSGLDAFRAQLAQVRDLERTIGRLSTGSGNARDLVALRMALEQIPAVKKILGELGARTARPRADGLNQEVFPSTDSAQDSNKPSVSQECADGPSALLKNLESQLTELAGSGGIDLPRHRGRSAARVEGRRHDPGWFRRGAGRASCRDAWRQGLDCEAAGGRNRTHGHLVVKVRFNSVFGYYIEVTKSNLDKVPQHYIRKQTVANGERYITPELKEMEGKILGAEERSVKLEYELFQRVREAVLGRLPQIQQTAAALAQLDVLSALVANDCEPKPTRERQNKLNCERA